MPGDRPADPLLSGASSKTYTVAGLALQILGAPGPSARSHAAFIVRASKNKIEIKGTTNNMPHVGGRARGCGSQEATLTACNHDEAPAGQQMLESKPYVAVEMQVDALWRQAGDSQW